MLNELLKKNNISVIKHKKIGNTEITKIKPELNIVTIFGNDNTFTIKRDVFNDIDKLEEKYAFCLINKREEKIYYLEFKDKNNWLKTSFERSNKEELYFGKIVLQHRITVNDLIKKIS